MTPPKSPKMTAMPSNLSIIIMAAGLGKRMHSDLPKVLHRLAGETLIGHVLKAARHLDPSQIVVVVGHGADQVQSACEGSDITFALQMPQHGTGHAVMQALPQIKTAADGVVLVLNGDVPLVNANALQAVVASAEEGTLTLLTHEMDDAGSYGRIVRDVTANIRRIVEFKDASAEEKNIREWYTGTMAVPYRHLAGWLTRLTNQNVQREYYLTDLVALAHTDGVPVSAIHADNAWEVQGINSRVDQAALERALQTYRAQQLLEAGATLMDPARVDIRGTIKVGKDVTIDINCVFEGSVTLGNGVRIGPNCVIRNATIREGAQVEAHCHIDGADVGAQSRVGPYARLRPGTQLASEVHIGNFVEVKASDIGPGSKANHLSYLGDASIGRDVNIGAGTITCNFDGANKHRTVIEDNVHIGSDVQLVAPVTIRNGATVAAGTTVWKDAPAGALTLNPKQQTEKTDWIRPIKKKKDAT